MNTMKTTFDFNFDFYQSVKQHGCHKQRSQEKLSIKKDSLWLLVYLKFEKKAYQKSKLK